MPSRLVKAPPNFFSIPFGLCGLAAVWRAMSDLQGTPAAVSVGLFALAAVVWLVLLAAAAARIAPAPQRLGEELADPALSPFWALPAIVGMLLAVGLEPYAHGPAQVVFLVFFVVTILFGGWITGQWFVVDLDPARFHPGYLLPTVAGGLVGAEGCAIFGLTGLGWLSFGIGAICWIMLGPAIVNRLFMVRALPAPLIPTMAIELAPPAVAGVAYLQLHGAVADPVAHVLAGYTGLMMLVQLRLVPLYARTRFSPAFWSFAFAWCAAAGLAIRWLAIEQPSGEALWATLVAAAASLLVLAIAARTVVELRRGEFLPPDPGVIPLPAAERAEPARPTV
jgi:tellurite resistance protein